MIGTCLDSNTIRRLQWSHDSIAQSVKVNYKFAQRFLSILLKTFFHVLWFSIRLRMLMAATQNRQFANKCLHPGSVVYHRNLPHIFS